MFLLNHGTGVYGPFFNTRNSVRASSQFGNRLYRNDDNVYTEVSDSAGINGGGLQLWIECVCQ
jgi:hypothetical protein